MNYCVEPGDKTTTPQNYETIQKKIVDTTSLPRKGIQRRSNQHHRTPPPATATTTRITRSQDISHRLPTTSGDNFNPSASIFQPSSGTTDGHDN